MFNSKLHTECSSHELQSLKGREVVKNVTYVVVIIRLSKQLQNETTKNILKPNNSNNDNVADVK